MRSPQKVVDKICEELEIPRIKVRIVANLGTMDGYFDKDKYEIFLDKDASSDDLFHEIVHYLVTLISKSDVIEEKICDYSQKTLREELLDKYPELKKYLGGRK